MYPCTPEEQAAYIQSMEQLKAKNRASREASIPAWRRYLAQNKTLSALRSHIRSSFQTPRSKPSRENPVLQAEYFSEQRIAVYTCNIGPYDRFTTPGCTPDNIDYYLIADHPPPKITPWNLLAAPFPTRLTNAEQNRWVKMHPHLLFPKHEYSIYHDANITPVSDLTELIHCIGPCGIATHQHYERNCVYQEGKTVIEMGKDSPERVDCHLRFLEKARFPKDYGLADCSVIARRHHNPLCIRLMEQWWDAFMAHCRRDQISFPYVLYQNQIKIEDVATLGPNRLYNDALYITRHL